MTIGDEFVGYRDNLLSFQEKYKVFILGISDFKCAMCCSGEIILHQIMRLFKNGDIEHEGGKIPVVRLDVQKHADMLKNTEIQLDFVPRIYLFFNGKYYLYNEEDNLNLFIAFINRILHPVIELNKESKVQNFIGTDAEMIESTSFYKGKYRPFKDQFDKLQKVTRVLGVFEDSTKYATKIEEFKKVARELAERTDLRMGIITDPELVKNYKNKFGPYWFNETSSNSIVVFREKPESIGRQRFYDVEGDDYNLKNWISFSSLDEVEMLTKYSAKILQDLNMPIFLALLPEKSEDDETSKELMSALRA